MNADRANEIKPIIAASGKRMQRGTLRNMAPGKSRRSNCVRFTVYPTALDKVDGNDLLALADDGTLVGAKVLIESLPRLMRALTGGDVRHPCALPHLRRLPPERPWRKWIEFRSCTREYRGQRGDLLRKASWKGEWLSRRAELSLPTLDDLVDHFRLRLGGVL